MNSFSRFDRSRQSGDLQIAVGNRLAYDVGQKTDDRHDEHPDTLIAISNMGAMRLAQGQWTGVVDLLAPNEAATRKAFTGANAYRLAKFLMTLGQARVRRDEFLAAETNLLEAHAIFAHLPGTNRSDPRDCAEAIVDLYSRWNTVQPAQGYGAKAAEWLRKLNQLRAANPAN